MNVIVVGAGRLGAQFAEVLARAGNAVTLVDRDREALARAGTRAAYRSTVHGDGCEPTVLEQAGAHAADILVATTGEDEDNLVVSLLAKRQFGVGRVVARINDGENTWMFDERWGVDVAVPSAAPLISLIEEATGAADTVALLRLGRAGVGLIETVIGDGSPVAGRPLGEVEVPPGCVVAAVIRAGQAAVPSPEHVLYPGDELLVISHTATAQDVHAAFQ